MFGRQEQCIDVQLAAMIAQDRHGQRRHARAVQDPADDVGALVAEEQAAQDLDLQIGLGLERP